LASRLDYKYIYKERGGKEYIIVVISEQEDECTEKPVVAAHTLRVGYKHLVE
jgi:L-amino acid N-acyltransferase YncA